MSNEAREIFLNNLKKIMDNKKKTQSDIARGLNLPLSTVSSWANGQSYPRVDSMQKLADFLNVSMRDLTDEPKESIPSTFSTAEEAIEFILRVPLVANFGGYDLDKMTDDEVIEFATDVAEMIKMLGKKHK